jgi:hypothetical protein
MTSNMDHDRFEPIQFDHLSPDELVAIMRENWTDVFGELASGDRARARKLLLRIGIRFTTLTPFIVEDGLTFLHLAARYDLREAAATLVGWGVQVDALTWPYAEVGPLWRRIGADLPVDVVGEYGLGVRALSPLHLAVLADHEEMVRFLLAHGANPKRRVGLDCGPEGIEWQTMEELARLGGGESSRVGELLREAQAHASTPITDDWVSSDFPSHIFTRLEAREAARKRSDP